MANRTQPGIDSTRPTLVVFQGGARGIDGEGSPSPLEAYLDDALGAATLDLISAAAEARCFAGVLLVTEDDLLAAAASQVAASGEHRVDLIRDEAGPGPFHFGETLRRVCEAHGLERVVYAGGGSLPLATTGLLCDLAAAVSGPGECVVANSLYSADIAAFYPASALARLALPAADNNLAWLLHYSAGLPFAAAPRTLATSFDIDTPPDLAVLRLAAPPGSAGWAVGGYLASALERLPGEMPHLSSSLDGAFKVISTRRAQLFVAGRISAWTLRRLEVNLPCQTRVLSEERGMQAGGRAERGEARSLLGYHLAEGPQELARVLEETCDAAFIDTRVLFAHMGLRVSRADRFASDALEPELISDTTVRGMTEALLNARVPVVLGGHSLVTGGLWALSERVRAMPAR